MFDTMHGKVFIVFPDKAYLTSAKPKIWVGMLLLMILPQIGCLQNDRIPSLWGNSEVPHPGRNARLSYLVVGEESGEPSVVLLVYEDFDLDFKKMSMGFVVENAGYRLLIIGEESPIPKGKWLYYNTKFAEVRRIMLTEELAKNFSQGIELQFKEYEDLWHRLNNRGGEKHCHG